VKALAPSLSPTLPPRRGTYALLALGFLAFVVYGSLVPLHYQPLSWTEATARFHQVCTKPVCFDSVSDWLTNIVLFIPLSFLMMAVVCVDGPAKRCISAAVVVLPLCALLSASVEFAQLWFPPRVSSLNDIVAETGGAAIGIMFWVLVGQYLTTWLRQTWASLVQDDWAARLLPVYVGVLLLIHAWPLDLTIRPADLWHKYRAGNVHLLPFATIAEHPWETVSKQIHTVLFFVPIGLLLARLQRPEWRLWQQWPKVLASGVLIAGIVTLLQFFVESRICDTTTTIIGTLAVVGGWAASVGLASCNPCDGRTRTFASLSNTPWLFLGAWLATLAFLNWQPFDFTANQRFLEQRWQTLSLVPFADYQSTNIIHAVDQFLNKVFLWVPVGVFLACTSASITNSSLLPMLLVIAFATVLEVGQFFLLSRHASVTDVILESTGAAVGWMLMQQGQIQAASDAVRSGRAHDRSS
jgi:glycopeptide antibiotics resistance protein